MRKVLPLLLLLSLTLPLASSEKINFLATVDLTAFDAIWEKHISIKSSLQVEDPSGISLKVPFNFLIDRSGGKEILFESGVQLMFYPWKKGPFILLSLAQVNAFIGPNRPDETVSYLNEIAFGYSWEFYEPLVIQLSLLYRDPSNSYQREYQYINTLIPTFRKFRFVLDFGWKFFSKEKR